MKNDCAVLINSCDAFEDTWKPFFTLMTEYWSECQFPVFLNTESKSFEFEKVKVLNHSKPMPWSDRVIKCLHEIKEEYVIVILDDFFISEKVNHDRILNCIQAMKHDNNIAVFCFAPSKWKDIDDKKYAGFELRPREGEYRFNMQAALWRKKDLLRLLKKGENPWQTENYGNFRARVLMPQKNSTQQKNLNRE